MIICDFTFTAAAECSLVTAVLELLAIRAVKRQDERVVSLAVAVQSVALNCSIIVDL